jgi:hypothetical protein
LPSAIHQRRGCGKLYVEAIRDDSGFEMFDLGHPQCGLPTSGNGLKCCRSDRTLDDLLVLPQVNVGEASIPRTRLLPALTNSQCARVLDAGEKVGAKHLPRSDLTPKRGQNVGEGLSGRVLRILRRPEDLAGNSDRETRVTPIQLVERGVVPSSDTVHQRFISIVSFENRHGATSDHLRARSV